MALSICIDPEHPSLPGHFPGQPIVPGVVLLGEIIDCYRQASGKDDRLIGVPMVKFKKPLLPGQPCEVEFNKRPGGKTAFVCYLDNEEIASGTFIFVSSDGDAES